MRTDIDRRLAALESNAGIGADRIDVIIRTFVRPGPGPNGPEDCPLIGVVNGDATWRLERRADEPRDEFLQRAFALVPRPSHGVACLREVL